MSEWIDTKLSAVAEIKISNVDKKSKQGELPVHLCNYMDVYSNDYIHADIAFMESTASTVEIEKFKVLKNDVLITKDSETPFDIGIPAVICDEIDGLVCGYHLALLRPKVEVVNPVYLSKVLGSHATQAYFSRVAAGSTRYGLSNGSIARTPVRLPSIKHQTKIANILETVDGSIEQTEALIEKYSLVKAGMMHDLFTRGLTPDGKLRPPREEAPDLYKETPIGWIPKEWETSSLEEVADVVDPNPSHRNPIYHPEGFAFISTVEFGDYDTVGTNTPRKVIEEIVLEQERRCKFSENSIAFSRKGTIGETRFLPTHLRFALLDSLCVINPQSVDTSYLFWALRCPSVRKAIKVQTVGQALPQMSIGRVRELEIPYPVDPIEQQAIGQIMRTAFLRQSNEASKLTKLKKQKSGLMHDLLTGEVPITIEDTETADV